MSKFKDLQFSQHPVHTSDPANKIATLEFDNGYGISVVTGPMLYSSPGRPYEVAVTLGGKCCYDTPIAGDVLGWQTEEEVEELIAKVEALPPAPTTPYPTDPQEVLEAHDKARANQTPPPPFKIDEVTEAIGVKISNGSSLHFYRSPNATLIESINAEGSVQHFAMSPEAEEYILATLAFNRRGEASAPLPNIKLKPYQPDNQQDNEHATNG